MPVSRRRPARSSSSKSRPGRVTPKRGSKGLSVKTYAGLNKKRMESKGGGGDKCIIKQGDTVAVQPLQKPSEMLEFDQHGWKDGGKWYFVPCTGDDDCEPCQSEDNNISRKSYVFACNVYNLKDRKVQVLAGPKTLATQMFYRYQRKPAMFLKRVYDITKFPTTPVTYNFEIAEEQPVKTTGLKLIDLDGYVQGELDRYYGSDDKPSRKSGGKSSLDDDDEDDLDEDDFDEDDEDGTDYAALGEEADDGDKSAIRQLKALAEEFDLDPDDFDTWAELADELAESDDDASDEDDEDEDDEEDDDEDEDDEDGPSEDEMMDKDEWGWSELQEYAREVGVRKTTKKRSELVAWIIKKRG